MSSSTCESASCPYPDTGGPPPRGDTIRDVGVMDRTVDRVSSTNYSSRISLSDTLVTICSHRVFAVALVYSVKSFVSQVESTVLSSGFGERTRTRTGGCWPRRSWTVPRSGVKDVEACTGGPQGAHRVFRCGPTPVDKETSRKIVHRGQYTQVPVGLLCHHSSCLSGCEGSERQVPSPLLSVH